MKRILGNVVVGLIVMMAMIYVCDWGIWRARVAMGGGMSKVTVSQIDVAPLKNNKEEYFWNGAIDVDCSRSIFPHAGSGPCWWLARHRVVYNR